MILIICRVMLLGHKIFEYSNKSIRLDDKTIWAQLKAIDLKEFFRKTRPTYRIMGCDLNYQDCKNDWKYQATINGHCLKRMKNKFFLI